MDSVKPKSDLVKLVVFALPMAVFITLLGLTSAGNAAYWVYPIQTVICGALVVWFWRDYEFRAPRAAWVALAIGVVVFALWIAPQQWLGFGGRLTGFDPEIFVNGSKLYWFTVVARFVRLVIVVPVVEEIFWRGFLLRYLISDKFTTVPVGSFSWLSFLVVTLAFTFSHSRPDWVAAFLCGALYNLVAYRTQSLASCVLAHATTNLLLGLWIMQTRQWGFW